MDLGESGWRGARFRPHAGAAAPVREPLEHRLAFAVSSAEAELAILTPPATCDDETRLATDAAVPEEALPRLPALLRPATGRASPGHALLEGPATPLMPRAVRPAGLDLEVRWINAGANHAKVVQHLSGRDRAAELLPGPAMGIAATEAAVPRGVQGPTPTPTRVRSTLRSVMQPPGPVHTLLITRCRCHPQEPFSLTWRTLAPRRDQRCSERAL